MLWVWLQAFVLVLAVGVFISMHVIWCGCMYHLTSLWQEWKPRWGYKRVNDPKEDWVLEVPENAGGCGF